MDMHGYRRVEQALGAHNIQAVVVPTPEEDQDVPYVTILSRGRLLVGAYVLNALDQAGIGENRELMDRRGDIGLILKS